MEEDNFFFFFLQICVCHVGEKWLLCALLGFSPSARQDTPAHLRQPARFGQIRRARERHLEMGTRVRITNLHFSEYPFARIVLPGLLFAFRSPRSQSCQFLPRFFARDRVDSYVSDDRRARAKTTLSERGNDPSVIHQRDLLPLVRGWRRRRKGESFFF